MSADTTVTIDYEDAEQVARLIDALIDACTDPGVKAYLPEISYSNVQIALREFAAPTPPRPDEPTGLGAVVEDADGMRWVAIGSRSGSFRWRQEHGVGMGLKRSYADIAAARVLSEGVATA